MKDSAVSIIIVNWNSGHHLQKCVESIFANSDSILFEIIIIDNASNDFSLKFLDSVNHENLKLIKLKVNLGFGAACNIGAKYSLCDSKYLLFLNPDAYLNSGCLSKTVGYMDSPSSNRIGICGVTLFDNQGAVAPSCFRFPSVRALFFESFGLSKIFKNLGRKMIEWDHMQTRRVDQVIGAFFFVRRSVYQMLEGFDERFFVYYEEVDFSLQAKRLGYVTHFYHVATAGHYGGGSSENVKDLRLFYSLQSRLIFFKKNHDKTEYIIALLLTCAFEPVTRIIMHLARLEFQNIINTISAYRRLFLRLLKGY